MAVEGGTQRPADGRLGLGERDDDSPAVLRLVALKRGAELALHGLRARLLAQAYVFEAFPPRDGVANALEPSEAPDEGGDDLIRIAAPRIEDAVEHFERKRKFALSDFFKEREGILRLGAQNGGLDILRRERAAAGKTRAQNETGRPERCGVVGHKLEERFERFPVEGELRLRKLPPHPACKFVFKEFEEGLAARGRHCLFDRLGRRVSFGLEEEHSLPGRGGAIARKGVDIRFLAQLVDIAELDDHPWREERTVLQKRYCIGRGAVARVQAMNFGVLAPQPARLLHDVGDECFLEPDFRPCKNPHGRQERLCHEFSSSCRCREVCRGFSGPVCRSARSGGFRPEACSGYSR